MQIFLGCTSNHKILHEVAANSFKRYTNDIQIRLLHLSALQALGLYWREQDKGASTEFTISRFFTPMLSGFQGWSLFCDNDIISTCDINEILEYADPSKAVLVVKQQQNITSSQKFLGNEQAVYPKKNWSSVVLWNCSHPKNRILQAELLNSIHPSFLHQFKWLSDDEIGALPETFNYLAKSSKTNTTLTKLPKLIHYTDGGPYFEASRSSEFSEIWLDEFEWTYNRKFETSDFIS